jgi:DNA-binding transcriptional LysR family regulator
MLKHDLNLLAVFDTLYELRSVTQAAKRLNLTQSAVSHALRRLREAVDDPLFLRAGGTLQPTPRARAMAPSVREGLARLREAILPTEFDPELSQRTFTVAATSYFCALLIPRLIAVARAQAPGIKIRTLPVYSDLLTHLDEGVVDLALGAFSRLPPRLALEPLFREELVWIAAKGNPVVDARPTHADLLEMPHLALDPVRTFAPLRPHAGGGAFETGLPAEQIVPAELHGSAMTPAIVYDTLTAIAVVAGTDLVALVPRRLALVEKGRLGVAIVETGGAGPGIDLVMVSRVKSSPDAGHDWLRSQVLELAATGAP